MVTLAFLRYLLRRRSLSVLQLLGISCGVAAAVGMTLSARASLESFSHAVEFIRGKATHSLSRPAGPLDERVLVQLMKDPAVIAFSPVIDRRVRLLHGETVRLLGIDPLLDRRIRPELSPAAALQGADPGDVLSFMLERDTVLLDSALAKEVGAGPGRVIETSRGAFRVLATFPNPSGEPLMLMDISHAQPLYGLAGRVDRVDLIIDDGISFRRRWERGYVVQSKRQTAAMYSEMLRAFRLNLEALSLLGLFVGIFLVYNTAMFAVVSRRKDAGILRSLGAGRDEIALAFGTEILLLGALGGALGAILGYMLSYVLTDLVGRTISNLYFFLRPSPLEWSWWIIVIGVFLGCGASLLGGGFPLSDLVRVNPVRAIHGRVADPSVRRSAGKTAMAGLLVLVASLALLPAAAGQVYAGFAGAFGILLGSSMTVGTAVLLMGPPLKWGLIRVGGLPGKVAAGNIRRNLGRTAVAVAAFMVALSMSLGLGSMIGSFRQTLVWWMDGQLRGDLYVAPSHEVQVPLAFYRELRGISGLILDPYRNAQIIYRGAPIYLTAIESEVVQRFTHFGWLQGDSRSWDAVKRGAVIVSESFSRRFQVEQGDEIVLEGDRGPVRFEVAAVFYDYTTEHGLIMMDRSTYTRVFDDRTIDSLVVFVDPQDPRRRELLEEVRRRADRRGLPVADQAQFHDNILGVFDATFAVTRSMRLLAVVVAFFGISGALLTLFMERRSSASRPNRSQP
jgi:putative ABC transport system permease protein